MAGPLTDACRDAALAPWRPEAPPRSAHRLRLFRDAVPEWIFRGHPAIPFVVVPPLIGIVLEHAPRAAPTALMLGAGALGWTLLEYLLHRFAFHVPARSTAGRIVTFVVHGHHHVHPDETSRLAATPVQMGSMILLVLGLARTALPAPLAPAGFAGALAGYLAYEAVHHLAHHERRPASRLVRALQRHHLAHHFADDRARFGISSPLWDWVFSTAGDPRGRREGKTPS